MYKKNILGEELLANKLERVQKIINETGFKGEFGEIRTDLGLSNNNLQIEVVGVGSLDKLTTSKLQKLANTIYTKQITKTCKHYL